MTGAESDGSGETSFGRFRLNLQRRELSCDGRPVRLGRRPLDILCTLAAARGSVVTKDDLMQQIWCGRAVEEGNIHVHVSALRKALGEDGDGHSFVITIPGRGYRLAESSRTTPLGRRRPTGPEATPRGTRDPPSEAGTAAPGFDASQPERVQVPERRQLTIVSCDIMGLARLATLYDPEEFTAAVTAIHRCFADVLSRFGGKAARVAGGTILGYFGYPRAGEHDAEQAIRAGLAIRDNVRSLEIVGEKPRLRLGIATGPVVIGDLIDTNAAEPGGLIGEAVTVADALRQTAKPDTVVIAAGTKRLVGDLFDLDKREDHGCVAGMDRPVEGYRVLDSSAVASRFEALRGSLVTALIGRDEETELLLRRWDRAKSGELQVVLISGEPGIGKSRLCADLQERIRQEQYSGFRYYCSPHHQDIALYPVVRQLEAASGFEQGDTADARRVKLRALLAPESAAGEDISLLAALLSLADPKNASSVEFAARRQRDLTLNALIRRFETASLRRPVLIVVEDVHWSDPTTLELLNLLLNRGARMRALVLITFRPNFVAPWTGQSRVTSLVLGRLNQDDGAALVRRVVGEKTLGTDVVEAISERTDGVPLFLEELGKAVAESDANSADPHAAGWQIGIPMTLRDSLMARLDRVPAAKRVAQIGAVIGKVFPYDLLAGPGSLSETQIAQGLQDLVAAGLATASGTPPEATYTFKHSLVQDAAYESLAKSRRTEVHAAIVEAYERRQDSDIEPGLLAHHCAQAGLIAKAAQYYRAAAERSIERAAVAETRTQLERGLTFAARLLPGRERDELEAELLLALGTVLQTTTSMSNADAGDLFRRATEAGRTSGRPRLLSRALWGQFTNVLVRGKVVAARALAERLLQMAPASGDVDMHMAARVAMGIALLYQGRFEDARQHLDVQQSILESQPKIADLDWRTMTAGPAFLALTLACLGYPEQAAGQFERAIGLAARKGAFALAYSLSVAVRVLIVLRDDDGLREHAVRLVALSEERGFHQFLNQGLCALGWLESREGDARGPDRICNGLAGMLDLAIIVSLPFYRSLLVDARPEYENGPSGLAALDDALALTARTGDTWFAAELHRRRGELLAEPMSNHASAEQELQRALTIAREQSSRLFELRAATSLARLWATRDKLAEAHNLLAPVHARFTEGFETDDLKDARQLLDRLAPRRVAGSPILAL